MNKIGRSLKVIFTTTLVFNLNSLCFASHLQIENNTKQKISIHIIAKDGRMPVSTRTIKSKEKDFFEIQETPQNNLKEFYVREDFSTSKCENLLISKNYKLSFADDNSEIVCSAKEGE